MKLLVLILLLLGANAGYEGYEGPSDGMSCNPDSRREEPRGQQSAPSCMVYCQLDSKCVGFTYYTDVLPEERHRRCSLCYAAGKVLHRSQNKAAEGYKKVEVSSWGVCPFIWQSAEVRATQNRLRACDRDSAITEQLFSQQKSKVIAEKDEKEEALRAVKVENSRHAAMVRELTANLNEQRSAYTQLVESHSKSQSALQTEKEELQKKIAADTAKLQTELEALRTQLEDKQTQHKNEKARMTKVNTVSEERIGELEAQVEAMEGAKQDATKLRAQLDQALDDRTAWETTLTEKHAKELAALQARSTEAETALKKCTDPTPEDVATKTTADKAKVALQIAVSNMDLSEELGEDACKQLELCPGEDGKFEIQRKGGKGRATCRARGCNAQNAKDADGTWVPVPGTSGDRTGVKLICVKPCAKEANDRAAALTAANEAEKAAAKARLAAQASKNLEIYGTAAKLTQLAGKVKAKLEEKERQDILNAQVAAEWDEQARRRRAAENHARELHEADLEKRAQRKAKWLADKEAAALAAEKTCVKVSDSTDTGKYLFEKWVAKLDGQAAQPEGQGCQNNKKAREAICKFQDNNKAKIPLDDIVELFEGENVNCRKYKDALKSFIGAGVCKDVTNKKKGGTGTTTLCDKRKMM